MLRTAAAAALALALAALAAAATPARAARDRLPPAEPFEETVLFETEGAAGNLTLPAGAPDRRAPLVVLLHDGPDPDGRATRYADQLLAAGYGVLDLLAHGGVEGAANAVAAARRLPRFEGQPVGVLGFGEGGRLALALPGPVEARAALYPGCDGALRDAARPSGAAVLLLHGAADAANPVEGCAALADALAARGAAVRWLAYRHAGYAWDRPRYGAEGRDHWLPRPDVRGMIRSTAWPEMAEFSASEVAGFFAQAFRGR